MTEYVCQNCGDKVVREVLDVDGWECVICGGEVLDKSDSGVVRVEELQELINTLRKERKDVIQKKTATDSAKAHRNGVGCGMDYCIEELEELIE